MLSFVFSFVVFVQGSVCSDISPVIVWCSSIFTAMAYPVDVDADHMINAHLMDKHASSSGQTCPAMTLPASNLVKVAQAEAPATQVRSQPPITFRRQDAFMFKPSSEMQKYMLQARPVSPAPVPRHGSCTNQFVAFQPFLLHDFGT